MLHFLGDHRALANALDRDHLWLPFHLTGEHLQAEDAEDPSRADYKGTATMGPVQCGEFRAH